MPVLQILFLHGVRSLLSQSLNDSIVWHELIIDWKIKKKRKKENIHVFVFLCCLDHAVSSKLSSWAFPIPNSIVYKVTRSAWWYLHSGRRMSRRDRAPGFCVSLSSRLSFILHASQCHLWLQHLGWAPCWILIRSYLHQSVVKSSVPISGISQICTVISWNPSMVSLQKDTAYMSE